MSPGNVIKLCAILAIRTNTKHISYFTKTINYQTLIMYYFCFYVMVVMFIYDFKRSKRAMKCYLFLYINLSLNEADN